ncbi:GNAT family N-acetyltransferase [Pedobacter cryoconitis]|uniref:Adenylate kinase family enzyme n=1 Tax=Pedobacter cryoconitis TaxID=188932 RepID=A0A327SGP7_9SPHI|nr:GNAT family N-acetyltransferase [Pedobacter cryoconitis]RAJ24917.1 adenylate kinase family enzyme [Pedobacter cryoconitis]
MKIMIFGASGSGTTTLAHRLSIELGFSHLDTDDYYWLKSEIPFELKRDPQERDDLFTNDFNKNENIVVSGSILNWNAQFVNFFDLVVFLWIPSAIRIPRLIKRETALYGELMETDDYWKKKHAEFIEWASGYDQPGFPSRSFEQHTKWLNKLKTPILRLESDITIEERLRLVNEKIEHLSIHQELAFTEKNEINRTLYDLLLSADPSIEVINSYTHNNQIFVALYRTKIIGAFVLLPLNKSTIEIKNIAVKAQYQGIGLGKRLLKKAVNASIAKGFKTLRIATGNSSIGQLALYQKENFELVGMNHNFFIDHYPHPIIENGIRCKHLLILEKSI